MILLGQILAGQYHLPVTRPCQLHGKKLRVYLCVLDARGHPFAQCVGGLDEVFYDTERKVNIVGRNKTRLEMWEEHLKDPIGALDKALKCMESSC